MELVDIRSCYVMEIEMSARINLIGRRFGAWRVVNFGGPNELGQTTWECRCDCGVIRKVNGQTLRNGRSKSCGCEKSEAIAVAMTKHGNSAKNESPEYRAWASMRRRCSAGNRHTLRNYAERGISVCDRWVKFENFLMDVGKIPKRGMTLDRVDNNKGYSRDNCRWADAVTQAKNRRPFAQWGKS